MTLHELVLKLTADYDSQGHQNSLSIAPYYSIDKKKTKWKRLNITLLTKLLHQPGYKNNTTIYASEKYQHAVLRPQPTQALNIGSDESWIYNSTPPPTYWTYVVAIQMKQFVATICMLQVTRVSDFTRESGKTEELAVYDINIDNSIDIISWIKVIQCVKECWKIM